MKKKKKWLAVLTAGAMVLTLMNMPFVKTESKAETQMTVQEKVSLHGLSNPTTSDCGTTWDCVYFGNYWQSDTNGDGKADQNDEKQPIKWRVLSVDGDDAFLLSDEALDCKPYQDDSKGLQATWETCSLRQWLNSTFLNVAFDDEEQAAIMTTTVVNEDNLYYNTPGGNTTLDKIFLLSQNEVKNTVYGFDGKDYLDYIYSTKKHCKASAYAVENNCWICNIDPYVGKCNWWLRSPGREDYEAIVVNFDGYGNYSGELQCDKKDCGIRPALHVNLSSSSWKYAGTVSANKNDSTSTTTPSSIPTPIPSNLPQVTPSIANNLNNPVNENGVTTWDCIYFGNYWQSDTNGDGKADQNDEKQPIKWRVLSVDGDDAFLLSDEALDCKFYDQGNPAVIWEVCSLRQWLNDTFLDDAFDAEEQSAIKTTTVVNEDNFYYNTPGGNTTLDRIFLLSQNDIINTAYGFNSDYHVEAATRWCKATSYAVANHCFLIDGICSFWWLRSPGRTRWYAAVVAYNGACADDGYFFNVLGYGVRPALHMNLSSASWKYAGTLSTSEDGTTTITEPSSAPTMTPIPTTPSATPAQQPQIVPSTPAVSDDTNNDAVNNSSEKALLTKTTLKSVKNIKGRKLTAKWKTVKNADGYQIQYAPNKKFKKAKRKTIKSTSVTIKKLKKKKTYFVRVRAYKLADGKKVYGKWSSVKKVKIKK